MSGTSIIAKFSMSLKRKLACFLMFFSLYIYNIDHGAEIMVKRTGKSFV